MDQAIMAAKLITEISQHQIEIVWSYKLPRKKTRAFVSIIAQRFAAYRISFHRKLRFGLAQARKPLASTRGGAPVVLWYNAPAPTALVTGRVLSKLAR
jgi:hypothetical protein